MALNEPPADPTAEQRANELARMIDGHAGTDEVAVTAAAGQAIVSAYIETAVLQDVEDIAVGEGWEVGHSHTVGEEDMGGYDEVFVSFDWTDE